MQLSSNNVWSTVTIQVKRFSYTENATSPSSIWSVERNCTSKCQPGCLMLGERTKLYVCTSCCSEPLCNDGNAGLSSLQRVSDLANIFLTVVVPVLPWMSSRLMFFWRVLCICLIYASCCPSSHVYPWKRNQWIHFWDWLQLQSEWIPSF